MMFILDGTITSTALNSTIPNGSSILFSAGDLTDEDHQLDATISLDAEGFVTVAYFEYVDPLFHYVLRVLR